jgi:two-component system sensor histidine kinase KdpD
MADYLRAECFAVYVRPEPDSSTLPLQRAEAIEKILNFARNLHIETRILRGSDVARSLIDFARVHQITSIFLARPRYRRWQWLLGRNLIHEIVREARDIEIIIVAGRRPPQKPRSTGILACVCHSAGCPQTNQSSMNQSSMTQFSLNQSSMTQFS